MKNISIESSFKSNNPESSLWSWIYRYSAITVVLCMFCSTIVSAQDKQTSTLDKEVAPLRLGLLPHLSSELLLKKYKGLITYLEKNLQRRVVVHTAPNFKTYMKRAEQGRYDLYLTAPHLAAYHENEHKHHRIAGFNKSLQAVIVVSEDSKYTSLSDLQGMTVAAPDFLAVSTLLGEVTFMQKNIQPGKDILIKYTPSHNNALHSVADSQADAAIAGAPAFKITTSMKKLKKPLRILAKTQAIPQMMFMSPHRIPKQQLDSYREVLLNINNDEAGKAFIESVPFGSLKVISDEDMHALSGMVQLLKQRM